ncbi:MAG: right-handed parallel beta-helix repeat-containing protein [Clostridia bacterium]|nr:right-handed parallel beta-helix repeat-containing protein [Clostridia bacterium]
MKGNRSILSLLVILALLAVLIIPNTQVKAEKIDGVNTYYVSPDGSDSNDGLSPSNAFKSVRYACEKAGANDIVIVGDGEYRETNSIDILDKKASKQKPFILKAQNKWKAKIVSVSKYNVIRVERSEHVIIEGLDISFEVPSIYFGICGENNNYLTIRDNIVHNCGSSGIQPNYSDNVLVEGNITYGNAKLNPNNGSGISVWHPKKMDESKGPGIIIRNNISFKNECRQNFPGVGKPTDGNGIIIDDFKWTQQKGYPEYTKGALVENNLCFNNGGAGISVFLSDNVVVRNNTVWGNGYVTKNFFSDAAELSIAESSHCQIYNNLAVSTDPNMFAIKFNLALDIVAKCNIAAGKTKINIDNSKAFSEGNNKIFNTGDFKAAGIISPSKHLRAANFMLSEGSPAIDSGYAKNAPEKDLNGNKRTIGGAPDIGAYEFGGELTGIDLYDILKKEASGPAVPFKTNMNAGMILGFSGEGEEQDALYGDIHLCMYKASKSILADKIKLKVTGTQGSIKCAIYSDNNGAPGKLLGTTEEKKGTSSGWNDFALKERIEITENNSYWLAAWSDEGDKCFTYGIASDNCARLFPAKYSESWPESFDKLIRSDAVLAFYADGTEIKKSEKEQTVNSKNSSDKNVGKINSNKNIFIISLVILLIAAIFAVIIKMKKK